jgi:hypothetical protein
MVEQKEPEVQLYVPEEMDTLREFLEKSCPEKLNLFREEEFKAMLKDPKNEEILKSFSYNDM